METISELLSNSMEKSGLDLRDVSSAEEVFLNVHQMHKR